MRGKTKVGAARSIEEIIDDPMATAAEIERLAAGAPRSALEHPNCPAALWWALAEEDPVDAPFTPAGQLFLLEEPERWEALARKNASRWIRSWGQDLSPPAQRLLIADCAERVLPLYEAIDPANKRPRRAVEAGRAYAKGLLTQSELKKVWAVIENARKEVFDASPHKIGVAGHVLAASAVAVDPSDAGSGLFYSLNQALCAVQVASLDRHRALTKGGGPGPHFAAAIPAEEDKITEQVWQWHRMVWYLRQGKAQMAPRSKVGARRPNTILKDPKASEAELRALLAKYPQAVLENPNCPAALWWELAGKHPFEAMKSSLYPLLTLECPERWATLETAHLGDWGDWLRKGMSQLSEKDLRLFGIECAERVLPLFEKEHPTDKRPRQAIEVARKFTRGQATQKQLEHAHQLAIDASVPGSNAYEAAAAVRAVTSTPLFAAFYGALAVPVRDFAKERAWQWHRLLEYLRGAP